MMGEGYLNREQTIQWYQDNRSRAIEKVREDGAGKVRVKCPLCEAMGDFTVLPDFSDSGESRYKVSYFCAECGFRMDDEGIKYFPPPPPPKHLRRKKR